MPRPLVSIVIAAYRPQPDHLLAGIASARTQSWSELEILVSDDSPTLEMQSLVEGLADPRIRYVHHTPGLGAARNHWWCFAQAKGDYVAILNHDDLYEPEFIETLTTALMQDVSASIAFCDHWIVDPFGRRLVADTESASHFWGRADLREGLHRPFLPLLAAQTIPVAMGSVFRRSVLPARLPDHAGPAYDLWLAYLLAREGLGAIYVRRRLSSWRTHPGNLTSQSGIDWLLGSSDCWQAVADDPLCGAIRDLALTKAARGYASSSVNATLARRRTDGLDLAARSLRCRVTSKGLVASVLSLLPAPLSQYLIVRSRA